jgi:hypothetical protein
LCPRLDIELDRPWQWLTRVGKISRAPVVSLSLGLVFAVVGWALRSVALSLSCAADGHRLHDQPDPGTWATRSAGSPLASGRFRLGFGVFRRNPRQIAVMGFVLLLVLLTWIRIAAMLFMLYWDQPSFHDLIINTFLKPSSLPFLIVGVGVGGLFAFFAFAISAISIPMLADQPRLDVMTAIVTSVRTVRENPGPMLLWAVLIERRGGALSLLSRLDRPCR